VSENMDKRVVQLKSVSENMDKRVVQLKSGSKKRGKKQKYNERQSKGKTSKSPGMSSKIVPSTSYQTNTRRESNANDEREKWFQAVRNEPMFILMLGHSYVKNFEREQERFMNHLDITLDESMNLDGEGIVLSFMGEGGKLVDDLYDMGQEAVEMLPQIVIIELGQNDMCWRKNNPGETANKLYEEVCFLFETMMYLRLVVVCQSLQKWKMMKGNLKLKTVNKHIVEFNQKFYQLSKGDPRIIRWRHKGLEKLTPKTSKGGTHANTCGGHFLYQKSISGLCKHAKREAILRRGRSKWATNKRRKYEKKNKQAERLRRKREREFETETDEEN
jgi:hypothetical protein